VTKSYGARVIFRTAPAFDRYIGPVRAACSWPSPMVAGWLSLAIRRRGSPQATAHRYDGTPGVILAGHACYSAQSDTTDYQYTDASHVRAQLISSAAAAAAAAACRFSTFVSSCGLMTCGDARCLTSCHPQFVSYSCHFFSGQKPVLSPVVTARPSQLRPVPDLRHSDASLTRVSTSQSKKLNELRCSTTRLA
jgi:hypothetical protein